MTIKELAEKYELTKDDFWKHKQAGWIIKHDACEKIATVEGINLENIKILNSERDFARFLVTMSMGDKSVTSIGEADTKNSFNNFIGSMAEKRGIDRCVLKLIKAYEYGVYSDVEADDFKKESVENSKDDKPTDYQKNFIRKQLTKYKLYDSSIVELGLQQLDKFEISQYIAGFKVEHEETKIGNMKSFVSQLKDKIKTKEVANV